MNLLLQLVAALSGLIIIVTVVALLNDQPSRADRGSVGGWIRHHARRLALVLMGAGAAMALLSVLTAQRVSLDVVVLVLAVALRQISHPNGWARFVFSSDAPGEGSRT